MDYPKYSLENNFDSTLFEFSSIGRKGVIKKVIRFSQTNHSLVYNLGFGDKLIEGDGIFIDDKAISDNGDRDKILATIANAIFVFTAYYPERYIYFTGVTPARMRLYRIAISNNLKELSLRFSIFGIVEDKNSKETAVVFSASGHYKGFLIKKL